MEKLCLPVKCNYETRFVCNESYIKYLENTKSLIETGVRYEVIKDTLAQCMEDLIKYCLTYNIEIDIPEGYTVEKIYNIVFATGDFNPDRREASTVTSSIIYSSNNKDYIYKRFKVMCDIVGKENNIRSMKDYYCWHTEDFAYNQIIHSYSIEESYIVKREEVI